MVVPDFQPYDKTAEYRERIEPLLMELAARCVALDLPFVIMVAPRGKISQGQITFSVYQSNNLPETSTPLSIMAAAELADLPDHAVVAAMRAAWSAAHFSRPGSNRLN